MGATNGGDMDGSKTIDKMIRNAGVSTAIGGGIAGFVLCGLLSLGAWTFSPQSWVFTDFKKFDYDNGLKITRLYRPGRDIIQVQEMPGSDTYVSLGKYLSGFEDKADRKLEEAKIKKLVDWYSE